MALSPKTIDIVRQTAPVVAPLSLQLTKHFYDKMFSNNPEVLQFFNKANQKKEGGQPQALANAVVAYASNIDNLGVVSHEHHHTNLFCRGKLGDVLVTFDTLCVEPF